MTTITTFLRPDSHMLNLMINNTCGGGEGVRVIAGHRFVIQLELTPATEHLEKMNPSSSTARAKLPSYFGGGEILEVGVSFSQMDAETFNRISDTRHGKNISQYFGKIKTVTDKLHATQVPNLYSNGKNTYFWLTKYSRTANEQNYASLLAGFDFYFQYSDDLAVYKAASVKLNEIETKGRHLGLSEETMKRIFKEEGGF